MGKPQPPVAGGAQAGVAFVGAQCVTAGGHEIDDAIELPPREPGIGQGRGNLAIERLRLEGTRARRAQNVLRQDVERAAAGVLRVVGAHRGGIDGGAAFQHLEAVARHQKRARDSSSR